LRTDAYATPDAIRSISEWIASLKIPTDPVSTPAATLIVIKNELEAIETPAARALAGDELDMAGHRPTATSEAQAHS
jgi:hypothetical protein